MGMQQNAEPQAPVWVSAQGIVHAWFMVGDFLPGWPWGNVMWQSVCGMRLPTAMVMDVVPGTQECDACHRALDQKVN